MKPASIAAIAEETRQYGVDPQLVLVIEWNSGTVEYTSTLIEVGSLTSQKKSNSVGMVSTIDFTLDDIDGNLKTIIDSDPIEYVKCSLYQGYVGVVDRVLLFTGFISSPIEWTEGERTFKFTAETKLKDGIIGFSADEGSIEHLNPDAVDKPWPLCFGNVIQVPALHLIKQPQGNLKYQFKGPNDSSNIAFPSTDSNHFYLTEGQGARFPQLTTVEVIIDGVIFAGQFNGDVFTVMENNCAKYTSIGFTTRGVNIPAYPGDPPDNDVLQSNVAWIQPGYSIVNHYILLANPAGSTAYYRVTRQEGNKIWIENRLNNPDGSVRFLAGGDQILEVAKNGKPGWQVTLASGTDPLQVVEVLSQVFWSFSPGTVVKLWRPTVADVYVANLVASNAIVSVWAERNGELKPIPPSYYTIDLNNAVVVNNLDGTTTQNCTTLTFPTALEDYVDQGWSAQIYVVLRSILGTNTAAQIQWLLETYGSLPVDVTTFTAVTTALANYPSNFALLEKVNLISTVEEIAFQARCGLIIDNGYVFIRYLSPEPSPDLVIGDSKTVLRSTGITYTPTEEIVTRLRATYNISYYDEEQVYTYLNNVARYGYSDQTTAFYIYNIPSLVQKSARFWGYRLSNSWRLLRAKAFMNALRLEVFDCVSVSFTGVSAAIKAIVDRHYYNAFDTVPTIELELWTPAKAGTVTQDPNAWMSDIGDTMPADPTLKYIADPRDYQLANPESKQRTIMAQSGGSVPAIVFQQNPGPAIEAGNDVDTTNPRVVVDLYGNGYDQPPTKKGVVATVVNPDAVPDVNTKIAVIPRSGRNYALTSAPAAAIYPAIIVTVGLGVYTVDLYADGFSQPATDTGITAYTIDSAPLFQIGDRISAFKSNGNYFIVSTPSPTYPIRTAIITINTGAPVYTYELTQYPGGPVIPLSQGTCKEMNGSTGVSVGTEVLLHFSPNGPWFFFPIGDCT